MKKLRCHILSAAMQSIATEISLFFPHTNKLGIILLKSAPVQKNLSMITGSNIALKRFVAGWDVAIGKYRCISRIDYDKSIFILPSSPLVNVFY